MNNRKLMKLKAREVAWLNLLGDYTEDRLILWQRQILIDNWRYVKWILKSTKN